MSIAELTLHLTERHAAQAEPQNVTRFRSVSDFPGWENAEALLRRAIEEWQPRTVLEIGSGANPTLNHSDVTYYGLRYITSDCDPAELAKADFAFETRCLDLVEDVPADLLGRCDLVFSRMVNEHVRDGRQYHANILALLSPGGVAIHAFSTLYTLPFLANRLVPSRAGDALYNFFAPRDRHQNNKFRAYYSWSRGPLQSAITRFRRLGYDVVTYDGYFGHLYYRDRVPVLHWLERVKTWMLLRFPIPLLCSYAVIVVRKPKI